MKSLCFVVIALLALPFTYASDRFNFMWHLTGPICGDDDMEIMIKEVAVALEFLGTSYLIENNYGDGGAKISDVVVYAFDKDRKLNAEEGGGDSPELMHAESGKDQQQRHLQYTWPAGSGEGHCRMCGSDDDDRRELLGKGMLDKMISAVDELAPEFLTKDISQHVSAECLRIAKGETWSVIFNL